MPGLTAVKAVHFTGLRTRIDALRVTVGLPRLAWTDPVSEAGVTRVRLAHLLELRSALVAAYEAAIAVGTEVVTEPPRAFVRGAKVLDALHVLPLLERKHRVVAEATALLDWRPSWRRCGSRRGPSWPSTPASPTRNGSGGCG